MEIKISFGKIPKGPIAKVVIGASVFYGIYKYCLEYLKTEFPNPLTPQVFSAISVGILLYIVTVYLFQQKRKAGRKP